MAIYCRILILSIIVLLSPSLAFAQNSLDCSQLDSVYCDSSWRGASELWNLFSDYHRTYRMHADFNEDVPHDVVFVWPSPPDLSAQDLRELIDNGAKILVFDESAVSLNWYRSLFNSSANAVESPMMPEAAHINGSVHLPVVNVDAAFRLRYLLPENDVPYRVAFNHPTPVIMNSDGKNVVELVFRSQANNNSGGALFVIRDESLTTRLMLNTLDNARFIRSVVDSMCDKKCEIHFFEPDFEVHHDDEPEDQPESFDDKIQKFSDFANESAENLRDRTKHVPWESLAFVLIAAWTMLAIAAAFSWNRMKNK